jgi:hypothetical protein
MSVMDMNSRMAMAEKLSVQQLQQAVQSGSLPAYIGIPLIEQKTKEKAQMAAAQQGQQKPPSVVASILQQADQQEQQEQGIDQLPSNLPTEQDEEMGMADGGIIAFAAGTPEGVKDPEQDPRIVALRQDPAYLAFAESGGVDGNTSLTAFLQAGNAAPVTAGGPEYEPPRRPPSRGRYDMNGPLGDLMNLGSNTPEGRAEAEQRAKDRQAMKDTLTGTGEGISKLYAAGKDVLSLPARAVAGAGESVITRPLRAMGVPIPYLPESFYGGDRTSMTPFMDKLRKETAARPSPAAPETAEAPTQGSLTEGITPASVAASEAALPKPTGAPSAGPRTAPQGGAPSSGRGALPSTLAAAERSDSPAANQATSMLDKYIAQLEKSGESVGRDKKEALYMALIQGGLAAAGGMSPNALQNIAQGATVGAQNYQQALASIKKDDRARLEKLISAGLKKEEFLLKAEEIGVKRDTARMVYDASMARTGAMGGSSAGADKQARLFAFNAGRELRQVEGDVAKLKNTDEYKEAARVMSMPYDPKKSSPAIKQMRERAQSVINSVNQETTRRVQDARGAVDFYRSEAGMPLLYSDGASGGGNMPKGIPQGSKQVGTSGGKPVYESPDGKRYIVE